MKVPKRFVNALRNKLGLSYSTVYNWSNYGVPESRVAEIEPVLEDIEQNHEEIKVPSWEVEPLRKLMGLPRGTVYHWHRYGVPDHRIDEVKEAMDKVEKQQGGDK